MIGRFYRTFLKFILVAGPVPFLLCSCAKEEEKAAPTDKGLTETISLTLGWDDVRSYLKGTTVRWSSGDEVTVFDTGDVGHEFVQETAGAGDTQTCK